MPYLHLAQDIPDEELVKLSKALTDLLLKSKDTDGIPEFLIKRFLLHQMNNTLASQGGLALLLQTASICGLNEALNILSIHGLKDIAYELSNITDRERLR